MCVLVYTLRNDTRSVAALTNVGPLTVRNTEPLASQNIAMMPSWKREMLTRKHGVILLQSSHGHESSVGK